MTLIELHDKFLNQANEQLLLVVTGLTHAEYLYLLVQFNNNKHGDQTTKFKKEKLLAAIIAVRFQLDIDAIKSVIMPGASAVAVSSFRGKVIPRLNNVLATVQALSHKIINHSLVSTSSILPAKFDHLDEFIERVQDSSNTAVLVTRNSRIINDDWLKAFISKPVATKNKLGQGHLLQLLTCFVFDFEEFKVLDDYLIWYMCIVLNVNMHCASYAARNGYGTVQTREQLHHSCYIRSQIRHPNGLLYKALTAPDARAQCLLPRNDVLFATIKKDVDTSFIRKLGKYDNMGFVKADKKGSDKFSYFSIQFAASGLRVNNFAAAFIGVKHYLSKNGLSLSAFLQRYSHELDLQSLYRDPMIKRKKENVRQLLNYAYQDHRQLMKRCEGMVFMPYLNKSLMTYKMNSAKEIAMEFEKLKCKKLALKWVPGTSIIEVKFYPTDNMPDIANNSEGVTNVIISFFVGLLNHNLAKQQLHVYTYRRQSFAFNRFSVAHISNMLMRMSMGYEPTTFLAVLKDTLKVMDDLLTRYPYYDASNKLLKKGFEVVENRDCAEEKKGNRFLNFARSDDALLKAVAMADNALSALVDEDDYIDKAYASYIGFITGTAEFIEEDGEHFGLNKDEVKSSKDNILIVGLLNNVLLYTLSMIEKYRKDNYAPAQLLHSYYFNIAKLMKYAHKAHALILEHTNLPASHVYAKALLLVDGMIEHLTAVRTIYIADKKEADVASKRLAILAKDEKNHAVKNILVPAERVDVFFADSGQQTFTIALFNLGMQVIRGKAIAGVDFRVSAFSQCYFELFGNLKDNFDLTICSYPAWADFIFVDIRELSQLSAMFVPPNVPKAKIIVIDCTHNPYFVDSNISDVVRDLLRRDIFVVINGSMLKHEQIGHDKFQAGKLIVFSPSGMSLNENVKEELNAISAAAMHPVIADYFIMINEICQDKNEGPRLSTNNLFKPAIAAAPAPEVVPAPKAAL